MKVVSATYLKSAMKPTDYPHDGRPEIAFCGKSNVGKSTLMNILLNKKGLAKTSARPGKTQTVNFFDVNDSVRFVDLPGYGFAKVSKNLRNKWADAMTSYLMHREPLRLVCQLLDARHKPTHADMDLINLVADAEVPTLLVATKVDKLKKKEKAASLRRIRETLELDDEALLIPFSALTREGLHPLWNVIDDCLDEAPFR